MTDFATETLFAHETDASKTFKLVRLARNFRGTAMTNLEANIVAIGNISRNSVATSDPAALLEKMMADVRDARDQLVSFGVWEQSITGLLMCQPKPIKDDVIILTAKDAAEPVTGLKVVSPDEARDLVSDDDGGPVDAKVVIDPFAERSGTRTSRNVETQIEVSVLDALGNKRKLPPLKLTLAVGPNKIEEVGLELEALKFKLKNQMFWGTIKKVEMSVSVAESLSFDSSTARRLLGEWSTKVKASLEADVVVPHTPIVIHVGLKLEVDQGGKVSPGIEFSFDF